MFIDQLLLCFHLEPIGFPLSSDTSTVLSVFVISFIWSDTTDFMVYSTTFGTFLL